MHSKARILFPALLLSLVAGCAGTDFVRPNAESFRLGQATSAQVLQQMGQPRQTAEILKNDAMVKALSYAYASTGGESLDPGVTAARAQAFYFHKDVLVGREFLSSFKSDHSNFDETKIGSILKGKTTRAEVIRLLGAPTGAYIHPMVKKTSGEAIGYSYQTTSGGLMSGFKFYRKSLSVTFDDGDRVAEVDYASTGSRPN